MCGRLARWRRARWRAGCACACACVNAPSRTVSSIGLIKRPPAPESPPAKDLLCRSALSSLAPPVPSAVPGRCSTPSGLVAERRIAAARATPPAWCPPPAAAPSAPLGSVGTGPALEARKPRAAPPPPPPAACGSTSSPASATSSSASTNSPKEVLRASTFLAPPPPPPPSAAPPPPAMERADEAGAEPERAGMDEADEECAACFSIASRGCRRRRRLTHAQEERRSLAGLLVFRIVGEEAPVRSH